MTNKRYKAFAAILVRNLLDTHYSVWDTSFTIYANTYRPDDDEENEQIVTQQALEAVLR